MKESQLVHTLLAHDLVDELHLPLYPLTFRKRQASDADRRGARDVEPRVFDTVSERRGWASLRSEAELMVRKRLRRHVGC